MGRLLLWARRPVDASSLAVFRICFGAIALWEVSRYVDAGWIPEFWVRPDFHFHYVGFGWVHPLPATGMDAVWVALGVSALAILAGALYRLATVVFAAAFGYVFLLDAALYLNHFYFLELLAILLAVVPAHRVWSVDAWIGRRIRGSGGDRSVPAWALWILRFQVGVLYVGGGIAKLEPDWLRGQPIGMWLAERTDFPLIGGAFDHAWAGVVAAWSAMVFDLLIVFAVAWRPTRIPALFAALAFHFANSELFEIGVFPFLALASLLLFCEPDWPRALVHYLQDRAWRPRSFPDPPDLSRRRAALARIGVVVGLVYVVAQVTIPLRHLAMPGRAAWTEAGHNFSWHMKLRDKEGEATFVIVDPRTGTRRTVRPIDDSRAHAGERLPEWQADPMAVRPELIRQYAHHLADLAIAGHPGAPRPQVHVLANVSLNGRPPQPMIDPAVDLAAVPATLGTPTWVVPLRSPLPDRDQIYRP